MAVEDGNKPGEHITRIHLMILNLMSVSVWTAGKEHNILFNPCDVNEL